MPIYMKLRRTAIGERLRFWATTSKPLSNILRLAFRNLEGNRFWKPSAWRSLPQPGPPANPSYDPEDHSPGPAFGPENQAETRQKLARNGYDRGPGA